MKKAWILLGLLGLGLQASAQLFQFQPMNEVPVFKNGQAMKHPWTGGMVTPQFGELDLNNDGLRDLVVYDRLDQSVTTWLRRIENGQSVFEYAPAFVSKIPALRDWFVIIDFNNDGRPDIFTGSNGGAMLYENFGPLGNPVFRVRNAFIDAMWDFGFRAGILVMNIDKPGIADFDGDGDIDIAAFDNFDIGKMNYFRNMSVERYGNADSLDYLVTSRCWGRFEEDQFSSNITINLGANCFPPLPLPGVVVSSRVQHLGSTVSMLDADKDGKIDLLLGDVESTGLKYLRNTGSADTARITQVFNNFPAYDTTIFVPRFPAAHFIDVDNDGRKDMLVAPNEYYEATLTNHVWYYRNQSSTVQDSFRLQSKQFLIGDILQYYTNAAPFMMDADNDGKTDLLVAHENGQYKAVIHFYKNQGTNSSPAFHLIDTSFLRLDTLNVRFPRLGGGDLNGDGRADLLIGTYDGPIIHYRNTGTTGQTGFMLESTDYMGLSTTTGPVTAPEVADFNRDGKPDLLIGTREGKVQYFINTGTATVPAFSLQNAQLGGIHVAQFFTGFAVPRLTDLNKNGLYDLVIGTERGRVYFYPDIEGQTGNYPARNVAFFYPQTGIYDSTRFSYYVTPCVGMLNEDTLPDLLVGTFRGGVMAFRNTLSTVSVRDLQVDEASVLVYPNPSAGEVFIRLQAEDAADMRALRLYDLQGRLLEQHKLAAGSREASFNSNISGILLLQIELADGRSVHRRLVIAR